MTTSQKILAVIDKMSSSRELGFRDHIHGAPPYDVLEGTRVVYVRKDRLKSIHAYLPKVVFFTETLVFRKRGTYLSPG